MKRNCRLRLKLNENKDIIYIYMHVCELHWNKLCWIFISISWFFFMNSFFFVLFVWRLKNNSELRYIRYQILLLMCSWMIQSRLTSEVIDKSSENLNLRIWKLEKKYLWCHIKQETTCIALRFLRFTQERFFKYF